MVLRSICSKCPRNAAGTVAHNRMKRILYLLFIAVSAVGLFSCDDNTDMLGTTIVPAGDKMEIDTVTFYAKSRSILANDSILANTNRVYLGRYTDPESDAVFSSDFIAQFNCVEDYGFPTDGVIGDSVLKIELKLFYNSYFGDSLNTMGCEVYELDRTLEEGVPYYTNIDPTEFYDEDKAAIAEKAYCAIDYAIHDSIRYGDDFTPSITIPLPQELGNRFIKKYYETDANGDSIGKSYFAVAKKRVLQRRLRFGNNVFSLGNLLIVFGNSGAILISRICPGKICRTARYALPYICQVI